MNTVYVVGIGPGNEEGMTLACRRALEMAEVIVGYSTYVDLLKPIFPQKNFFETGMTSEVERCEKALDFAAEGKRVVVVSSGDAAVYGMAGLMMELAEKREGLAIEVIPGVTAALSGAALLGAPLSNDFAVISLSDLLTPYDLIMKRLRAVAEADLCLVLYNPGSLKRSEYLRHAVDILLESRPGTTPCGLALRIGREGETVQYLSLAELKEQKVDMFTTVFIGNSCSRMIKGQMVTERGYKIG